MSANKVLDIARGLLGATKYGSAHLNLVKEYNTIRPLPVGYAVTNHDDWCDIFVTVVFKRAGLSNLIGAECGVERHIQIFKKLGIWIEDGRQTPKAGDIITFHWGQYSQPNDGFANHIGIVEKVENGRIHTMEGNSNNAVRRLTYPIGHGQIRGFARPKYSVTAQSNKTVDQLANEVLQGLHGDGNQRKTSLGSRYDEVQKRVNEMLSQPTKPVEVALKWNDHTLSKDTLDKIIKLAKHYQVLPSLAITLLHFEGLWGNSNVAKSDNNWGGMTMPTGETKVTRPSGVVVTRGSKRPANEGGYYMKFASVDDFLKDWLHLFRNGGIYDVSGKTTLTEAVKGMFRPQAKYDYAAIGLDKYMVGVASRLKDIELQNGSLKKYDDIVFKDVKPDDIVVVKDDLEVTINGVTYRLERVK